MARTNINAFNTDGSGAVAPQALTFTAGDTSNNNSTASTGHETILVFNTDSSAHIVTVHSVNGSIQYSVPAASGGLPGFVRIGPIPPAGWMQNDGTIWFDPSDSHIQFVVIRV